MLTLILGVTTTASAVDSVDSVAPLICSFVDRDYVDRRRVEPTRMVAGVISALQVMKPDISATWEPHGLILRQLGRQDTVIPCYEPTSVNEVATLIRHLCDCFIAPDGGCRLRNIERNLEYALLNGALGCLDPYTKILPPMQARARGEELAGGFGGIGANLRKDGTRLVVDGVRPGLPADRAGLTDGDHLVTIDGHSTTGMTVDAVIAVLRGTVGTTVTWSIERPGVPRALTMTAMRAEIPAITLRSYRAGDVLYVRLDEFSACAAHDLRTEIRAQCAASPFAAMVLDLRHNGGGIVDQACEISADFLPRGSDIVRVIARNTPTVTYATRRRPILDVPMVVLVSDHTASAAEILAGTLQCHERALVVGALTRGKGLIQTIRDLPDGSQCTYSVGEYLLPGDIRVQGVGIMPDIVLSPAGMTSALAPALSSLSAAAGRYRAKPLVVMDDAELDDVGDTDLLAPHFVPDAAAQFHIHLVRTIVERAPAGNQMSPAANRKDFAAALVAEIHSTTSFASTNGIKK